VYGRDGFYSSFAQPYHKRFVVAFPENTKKDTQKKQKTLKKKLRAI
jgi:hypothetical protein